MKHLLLFPAVSLLACCGNPATEATADHALQTTIDSNAYRFGGLVLHLMGDWIDAENEPGAIVHERWSRTDDGFHSGIGFVMVDKDTVFIEHLSLSADSSGHIAYKVRVPSQNEGGTISFALSHCAGDSMVFENPGHDFPQRISYALQTDGDWTARVSGPGKEGKPRILRYRFKRATSAGS